MFILLNDNSLTLWIIISFPVLYIYTYKVKMCVYSQYMVYNMVAFNVPDMFREREGGVLCIYLVCAKLVLWL